MQTIDMGKKRFVAQQQIASERDAPLSSTDEVNVKVFRYPAPDDLSQDQLLAAVEQSGTIDFWLRPEEDGYTEADGTPL